MHHGPRSILAIALVVVLAIGAAGCGGSKKKGGGGYSATPVSIR